jgi:hypothetical protein
MRAEDKKVSECRTAQADENGLTSAPRAWRHSPMLIELSICDLVRGGVTPTRGRLRD